MPEDPATTPGVTRFVHVGHIVEDLDETVRFLTVLGFRCSAPFTVGGAWVDRIVGLEGAEVENVMVRLPDGGDAFEITRFVRPQAPAHEAAPAANRPGLRHVAFQVDDARGVVDRVRAAGWDLVGELVDYEGQYLMGYVRGPEGLIVEIAEPLG